MRSFLQAVYQQLDSDVIGRNPRSRFPPPVRSQLEVIPVQRYALRVRKYRISACVEGRSCRGWKSSRERPGGDKRKVKKRREPMLQKSAGFVHWVVHGSGCQPCQAEPLRGRTTPWITAFLREMRITPRANLTTGRRSRNQNVARPYARAVPVLSAAKECPRHSSQNLRGARTLAGLESGHGMR